MSRHVAVVGLGYVGLPLAVEFGRRFDVVGYDLDTARIAELKQGRDRTRETSSEEFSETPPLSDKPQKRARRTKKAQPNGEQLEDGDSQTDRREVW